MKDLSAEFMISSDTYQKCPKPDKPEIAFIGRSNVGKSSLINMLCNHKNLAKTSGTPGKTQLINHFLVDKKWYLVDLPGYGYAKISKKKRENMNKMIYSYLQNRVNLFCVMVLIDSRHEPQKNDMELITWLGEKQIPFVLVFTKADKLSTNKTSKKIRVFKKKMLQDWEFLPPFFVTSAVDQSGKETLIDYINNEVVNNPVQY